MKLPLSLSSFAVTCIAVVAASSSNPRTGDLLQEGMDSILETVEFQRRLADQEPCEGAPEINYFDISIALEPSSGSFPATCTLADQVLLGHDLNVVLTEYGLGDSGHENVYGLGGVCPTPEVNRRKELRRNLGFGFVYRGGYACKKIFCNPDNSDARRLQQAPETDRYLQFVVEGSNEWFETVYAPQLEQDVEQAILDSVVPNHSNCLGPNPAVNVEASGIELDDLDLSCSGGDALEFLEITNLYHLTLGTEAHLSCSSCKSLDFSVDSSGFAINNGQYVQSHWKENWGVTVSAAPRVQGYGYTPDGQPRILDSTKTDNLDADLQSPNKHCPGGGIGVGDGGMPGQPGENCVKVGNVLIVQYLKEQLPNDSLYGGTITFTFDEPVLFSDIGLMDIDEIDQTIKFYYTDGTADIFTYRGLGNNSVQRVIANKRNVVKVDVTFPNSGAITEINFCPECDFVCFEDQVISTEDFQGSNALDGWTNGILENGSPWQFTQFLGRYDRDTVAPAYKTYNVPSNAAKVVIELDFYEIDSWDTELADIYIDNELVSFGTFNWKKDEGFREGTAMSEKILWSMDSITTPQHLGFHQWYDQKHRIQIEVWKSSGLFDDGKLQLKLTESLTSAKYDESAGWDNIVIKAMYDC